MSVASRLVPLTFVVGLAAAGCAAPTPPAPAPVTAAPAGATSASPSPSPTPSRTDDVDCRKVKCIALTYDDGPSPSTPKLLDALAAHHGHATFFLIGPNATQYPATVRRQQTEGMEVANHTSHHPALTSLSDAGVRTELRDTQRRIHAITGRYPTLMRPPYGARSAAVDRIAGREKLAVVTWDTSPKDWEDHSADSLVRTTVAQARPNQIVLMHDTHPWTVQAAPRIMDRLAKKGYHFVTVSQLLGDVQPGRLYPRH